VNLGLHLLALAFVLSATPAAQAQTAQTFSLPPGGKAVVTFEAFCQDFGRAFPKSLQLPASVASDQARAVLAYAQNNQLTDNPNEAREVQYALWRADRVSGSPQGGALAQQIIDSAKNPPAAPQGTSLVDAATTNQITITLTSWQPRGDQIQVGNVTDNFHGRGQLSVENTSQQNLVLYMPIGTVFPSTANDIQNMAGFQTNVQVQVPQQLPRTAVGAADISGFLFLAAVVLLTAGWVLRRRGLYDAA